MANILQERERTFKYMLSSIAKCSCVDNKQSDMLHLAQSHFPLGWACFPTLPSVLHRTVNLWASPIAVFWVRRDKAAGDLDRKNRHKMGVG